MDEEIDRNDMREAEVHQIEAYDLSNMGLIRK